MDSNRVEWLDYMFVHDCEKGLKEEDKHCSAAEFKSKNKDINLSCTCCLHSKSLEWVDRCN